MENNPNRILMNSDSIKGEELKSRQPGWWFLAEQVARPKGLRLSAVNKTTKTCAKRF
jgi:hypothetical protein